MEENQYVLTFCGILWNRTNICPVYSVGPAENLVKNQQWPQDGWHSSSSVPTHTLTGQHWPIPSHDVPTDTLSNMHCPQPPGTHSVPTHIISFLHRIASLVEENIPQGFLISCSLHRRRDWLLVCDCYTMSIRQGPRLRGLLGLCLLDRVPV